MKDLQSIEKGLWRALGVNEGEVVELQHDTVKKQIKFMIYKGERKLFSDKFDPTDQTDLQLLKLWLKYCIGKKELTKAYKFIDKCSVSSSHK